MSGKLNLKGLMSEAAFEFNCEGQRGVEQMKMGVASRKRKCGQLGQLAPGKCDTAGGRGWDQEIGPTSGKETWGEIVCP